MVDSQDAAFRAHFACGIQSTEQLHGCGERLTLFASKASSNLVFLQLWTFLALALLTELHAMCVMTYLTATSSPSPQLLWIGKVSTRTFNLFFFVVFTAILVALTTSFGISEVRRSGAVSSRIVTET